MKFVCSTFFLLSVLFATAQKRGMRVTDMLNVKTVQSIVLSPDGRKAAFVLNTIEPQDNKTDYSYHSQIYTISTSLNSTPRQVTFAKDRASQPSWSPDGNSLAFVRTVDSRPQIFILPMSG